MDKKEYKNDIDWSRMVLDDSNNGNSNDTSNNGDDKDDEDDEDDEDEDEDVFTVDKLV